MKNTASILTLLIFAVTPSCVDVLKRSIRIYTGCTIVELHTVNFIEVHICWQKGEGRGKFF